MLDTDEKKGTPISQYTIRNVLRRGRRTTTEATIARGVLDVGIVVQSTPAPVDAHPPQEVISESVSTHSNSPTTPATGQCL